MVSQVQVLFSDLLLYPFPNSQTKTEDGKNNHTKYGSTQVVLTWQ